MDILFVYQYVLIKIYLSNFYYKNSVKFVYNLVSKLFYNLVSKLFYNLACQFIS